MIYPSIDKLLNQVGSKYLLVNVVSKRVHEMEEKQASDEPVMRTFHRNFEAEQQ